ncbi:MAG: hypothetical protein ACOH14_14435 [Rhodoglobus sp.]
MFLLVALLGIGQDEHIATDAERAKLVGGVSLRKGFSLSAIWGLRAGDSLMN